MHSVNLAIETMYNDIVDIIYEETSKDSWSDEARNLMREFIKAYKKDPWNFIDELDVLIDETTSDKRKLEIFDKDNVRNLKYDILNFTDY